MSLSKSIYNSDWSDKNVYPDFAIWVREVPNDPYSAYCSFCKKKFSLSNMGKQALTSHSTRSKRHKILIENFNSSSLNEFIEPTENSEEGSDDVSFPKPSSSSQPISNFLVKQDTFRAEIIWALKLNDEIRLDDFYFTILKSEEFSDLLEVIKIVLILSHGNAAVESGFSVNKDMLVENLKEDSLIGLRTVYDAINFYGGVLNVPITKELINYAKLARARYYEALEKQKSEEENEKEIETNKRKAAQQIKLLQKKKMKLINEKFAEVAQIDEQISELAKQKDC